MPSVTIEVCVDNIASFDNAVSAGADRIELCSALPLGGLTPTYGLSLLASRSPISTYAMIRPRGGYFVYSANEVDLMCDEIQCFRDLGFSGIVVGALTTNAQIDIKATSKFVSCAGDMGVTFHRAFDLVVDPFSALESLIDLGCERVLTSGCESTATAGIECIRQLVEQSQQRISIMPGCGVNKANAKTIIDSTGAREIHLSAKRAHPSPMRSEHIKAAMGSNANDDHLVGISDAEMIAEIVRQLR